MGTAIVLGALLVIVFCIIRGMVKAKAKGKSLTCGCDCSKCSGHCN